MKTCLIHVPLDMRAFSRWAGQRGLVRRGAYDADYALHILLSAMFGKGALQPFRLFWSERRRCGSLYAYADSDHATLQDVAADAASPDCLAPLNPAQMISKPMPSTFAAGQRLGFDLRVRPIRRLRRDMKDPQSGEVLSRGKEVDAYRLEALYRFPDGWRQPGGMASRHEIVREAIYTSWLAERLGDAAKIDECRLAAFRRTRVVRGDGAGPEGPDATLHGTLAVQDPEGFARRLREGVGRHRAYGYGMMLLRPRSVACKSAVITGSIERGRAASYALHRT